MGKQSLGISEMRRELEKQGDYQYDYFSFSVGANNFQF